MKTDLDKIKKDIAWLISQIKCFMSIFPAATTWSNKHSATTGNKYLKDTLVWDNGFIYKCLVDNNSNPTNNSFYWEKVGKGWLLQQEQADWNATGGPSFIRNKPTSLGGGTEEDPIFVAWLATDPLEPYYLASNPAGYITLEDLPTPVIPTFQQVTTAGATSTNGVTFTDSAGNTTYVEGGDIVIQYFPENPGDENIAVIRPTQAFFQNQILDSVYRILLAADIDYNNVGLFMLVSYGGLESQISVELADEYYTNIDPAFGNYLNFKIPFKPTGDYTLATLDDIPTVGTWGGLNYPTWTTGTPFVKMTAAGTFALDTTTYTPASRTLTINGTTFDLTADRTWTISSPGGLPTGGTAGQILTKVDGTDYNATWQENYADWTSVVKHTVKNDGTGLIAKGTAVYVTGSNGTNILVGKASNASEATSSKTMGLMQSNITTTGGTQTGFVITEGLLSGLNTAGQTAGDPVWLGVNGALIYGLINKPYAPAHLVFIGIVTKVSAGSGEIFVKVQNGFELKEIHDVDLITTTPVNGHILGFDGTLWVNKTVAGWLGFTPGTVTSVAALTLGTTGTDLSSTVATGTTTPVITLNVPTASATNRGALSSADWTAFNNRKRQIVNDTTSVTTTGVAVATLVKTYEITTGTLPVSGFLDVFMYLTKVAGASGGYTLSISVNSVNNFVTATSIAGITTPGNFIQVLPLKAKLVLKSGTVTGANVAQSTGDNYLSMSATPPTPVTCNNTAGSVWFFVSVTPTSSSQSWTLQGVEITI